MTWDSMADDWQESQTKVRRRWARLTDEDLRRINGKRDELVAAVAERYSLEPEEAEVQVEDFELSAEEGDEVSDPESDVDQSDQSAQPGRSGSFGQRGQSHRGSDQSGAMGQAGERSRRGADEGGRMSEP